MIPRMIRCLGLAAAGLAASIAVAAAQGAPGLYDTNNNFGLSNAGVTPGPYLKLDGGYSWSATSKFGDSPVFGGGLGWRFAPFFRMDATFDYRNDSTAKLAGDARLRNWAAMLNGYIDFNVPFLRPLVPYIGAGAGIDQNKVGGSIVTVSGTTPASLTGSSKNQFAWQAMAGLAWYISPTLALDVTYRYFYGGRAESGSGTAFPVRGDYSAHEVVGGLRWGF
jgi:opacity protein-like surface antigen